MNASCEIRGCQSEAILGLGGRYFCKIHELEISEKLKKQFKSDVSNSHHIDVDTLNKIINSYGVVKLKKSEKKDDEKIIHKEQKIDSEEEFT